MSGRSVQIAGVASLAATLRTAAAERPGAPALRAGGVTLDHAALYRGALRVAERLRAAGVAAGDRVAVALPNTVEFAVCYHGVLAAGAVAVPLHVLHGAGTQQDRLRDCEPAAVLVAPETPDAVRAAASAPPLLEIGPDVHAPGGPDPVPADDPDPSALAVLAYGLVGHGRATAVQLTHANLAHAASAAATVLRLGPDDVVLGCFPLASVLGQTLGTNAALAGGACLALPGDVAGDGLLATLTDVTVLATYPVLLPILLEQARRAAEPPSLRAVVSSGGAPVRAEPRAALHDALGCELLETFGPAESAGLACVTPSGEAGSVPVPGVEIRILDRGRETEPGRVGELAVRGPLTTPGYWCDPEATAAAIRSGWCYTGYSAVRDPDGGCHLVDRGWAGGRGRYGRPGLLRGAWRRVRA